MKTLAERLNFSAAKQHENAIEISLRKSVNHYETLCHYCAENDIDLSIYSQEDIDGAADAMADHGSADISEKSYWFWID